MNIFRDNYVNCSNKIYMHIFAKVIIVHISCTLSNMKDSRCQVKCSFILNAKSCQSLDSLFVPIIIYTKIIIFFSSLQKKSTET